jgi:hypothetical protein
MVNHAPRPPIDVETPLVLTFMRSPGMTRKERRKRKPMR